MTIAVMVEAEVGALQDEWARALETPAHGAT